MPSFAGVAQLVEHYLAKVDVESSNLFARSTLGPPSPGGLFAAQIAWVTFRALLPVGSG
jgi:hypothetical protein